MSRHGSSLPAFASASTKRNCSFGLGMLRLDVGASEISPGLYASDLLRELIEALRAFDRPHVVVLVHGFSSDDEGREPSTDRSSGLGDQAGPLFASHPIELFASGPKSADAFVAVRPGRTSR